jgi:hypothetical protein
LSDELFQDPSPKPEGSVAGGFILGLLPGLIINLMSFGGTFIVFRESIPVLGVIAGIAIGQLLFTVPFYFHFTKHGKPDTCRGLLIGASLACLIGVSCGAAISF